MKTLLPTHQLVGTLLHPEPGNMPSIELPPARNLTDTTNTIPVMVARTGVRTLLYGGGGNIELRYFPTDADLQPNDVLVTSGLDSVYPAGIPVAKVLLTSRNAGTPFYRAELKPVAALRVSKYVLVLPQTDSTLIQAASAAALVCRAPIGLRRLNQSLSKRNVF